MPTPFDRNYGTKLGVRAVQWLTEKMADNFRLGERMFKTNITTQNIINQIFQTLNSYQVTQVNGFCT